jgi:type IV pilus assembly protein PilC
MSKKEQIIFWRRLALYLQAGISLPRALVACTEDNKNKRAKIIIASLERSISQGESLSVACGRFPKQFKPFAIQFLRAGEMSGTLSFTIQKLATIAERQQETRGKLVSAAIYPVIVGVGIFPRIIPIIQGFHTKLPLPTKILLWTNVVITKDWIFLCALVAIVFVAVLVSTRYKKARAFYEWIYLRIPFIGEIYRYYMLATFFSMGGTLLRSGIQLLQVVPLAGAALQSSSYREHFKSLEQSIASGKPISQGLYAHPFFFPSPAGTLISAGEMTGTLRESFDYLGDHFERRLDDQTRQLTILIEPLLMVVMGLGVGFIALAIILPMYSITQGITIQ